MTDDRRQADRRSHKRRSPSDPATPDAPRAPESRALVPAGPPRAAPPDVKPRRDAFTTFAAQILGQGGQKRGLRAGPPALDHARSTYLETEWSGPADRRPHPGRITKTEI